jgi:hypothetical protein
LGDGKKVLERAELMLDYEKIAEGIMMPDGKEVPQEEVFETLRGERKYLPVDHDKYQGIATAKGYAQGEDYSGHRLVRTHYSHEAMIDVILANPTMTQRELAKQFSRSENWVSIVMGSDAFQAALAKRRDDVTDPFLVATIEERFRGLATQSLEVIAEKLEKSRNTDLALKALDISAKALGFGARGSGNSTVQNNFVVQLPSKMQDAAAWAEKHVGGAVIDG